MKRSHRILLTAFIVFAAAALILFLRPPDPLDLSKDEEPFKSMVLPPKLVVGRGSNDSPVEVFMVDSAGNKFQIGFPFDRDGIINAHSTAYYEPSADSLGYFRSIRDSKMICLKNPARAKAISIKMLLDYGQKIGRPGSTEDAKSALSESAAIPSRLWERAKHWFY